MQRLSGSGGRCSETAALDPISLLFRRRRLGSTLDCSFEPNWAFVLLSPSLNTYVSAKYFSYEPFLAGFVGILNNRLQRASRVGVVTNALKNKRNTEHWIRV